MYAKIRHSSLDVGALPLFPQLAGLAMFCLLLYNRNPRFQQMAKEHFATDPDGNSPFLSNHAESDVLDLNRKILLTADKRIVRSPF